MMMTDYLDRGRIRQRSRATLTAGMIVTLTITRQNHFPGQSSGNGEITVLRSGQGTTISEIRRKTVISVRLVGFLVY
jgi:hypothetical protein